MRVKEFVFPSFMQSVLHALWWAGQGLPDENIGQLSITDKTAAKVKVRKKRFILIHDFGDL